MITYMKYVLDATSWFLDTDLLPNKSFPIIFNSIHGSEDKDASNSFFNMREVAEIMNFVRRLLDGAWNGREVNLSEIGIISPYKAQNEILKRKCWENAWDKITIGTVENFQGQEREIIILSIVRSEDLGFVRDRKVRKYKSLYLFTIHIIKKNSSF